MSLSWFGRPSAVRTFFVVAVGVAIATALPVGPVAATPVVTLSGVVTQGGVPLAGADVVGGGGSATTDANGAYSIQTLEGSSADVRVQASDQWGRLTFASTADVTVGAGGLVQNLDLPAMARVDVSAVDGNSNPLANATVALSVLNSPITGSLSDGTPGRIDWENQQTSQSTDSLGNVQLHAPLGFRIELDGDWYSGPIDYGAATQLTVTTDPANATLQFAGVITQPATVQITSPADRAYYTAGQNVTAAYSCEGGGVATIVSCTGDVPLGASVDTSTVGVHSFSVTALDSAGHSSSKTVSYTVVASVDVTGSLPIGGGTVTTDPGGTGTSATVPMQSSVSSPNGGVVEIVQGATTESAPGGYAFAGLQVTITAPPADVVNPLQLHFSLDPALLASMGTDPSAVAVLRDGVPISDCTDPGTVVAQPDPCVFARAPLAGGGVDVGVYSSHASIWNFAAPICSSSCISVGDRSMLEGDPGTTHTMVFPVTLSAPASSTVTVDFAVTGITATGGTRPGTDVDFKLKSGMLTFTPNARSGLTPITKNITVTVFGDTSVEPDETFAVTLSNPSSGYLVGRNGTGTIVNDDGIASGLTLGVGDTSIALASGGKQSLKFEVTLSANATRAFTVDYTITPGSATYSQKVTGGGDYGGKVTKTLSFAVGAKVKSVSVPIWADPNPDTDETFAITLSNLNGTGVTLIAPTATATILG